MLEVKQEASTTRAGTKYQPTMTDKLNLTVSPALPTFSTANPRAWFRVAESRFSVSKLSDEEKVNRVLEAIPGQVFEKLASWLEVQDAELKYTDLKTQLLTHYSPSGKRSAKRIIELVTGQHDEAPSAVWQQIDSLQRDIDGNKIDLAWHLWLHHLSPEVRAHIQDSKDDKPVLIKRADTLTRQLGSNQIMAASQRNEAKHKRNDKGRKEDKQDREQLIEGMCWYHNRFGNRARACIPGCKHYITPKNDKGSYQ